MKRKGAALSKIAGPSNRNQKEKPVSKHMTKEKVDGAVLKKSTVTTTATSTIQQPSKDRPVARRNPARLSSLVQSRYNGSNRSRRTSRWPATPQRSTLLITTRRRSFRLSRSALYPRVKCSSPWTRWMKNDLSAS